MSFYFENLNGLADRDVELLNRVKSVSEKDLPVLKQMDGHAEIEVTLASQKNLPFVESFAKQENQTEIKPNTRLVIFLGFGIGSTFYSHFEALEKKQAQLEVLVIEKDPSLFSLGLHICNLETTFRNPRYQFWVGMSDDELRRAFMNFFVRTGRAQFVNAIQVISHPALTKIDATYYRNVEKIANEVIHYSARLYGDSCDDSFRGFENFYRNLKTISEIPYLSKFEGVFKNIPAIVVASGPSLEKSLGALKECQDRALLIAADSAVKPLLKAGIRPHLVVSIERDDIIPDFYRDCGEDLKDIGLVACPVVIPEVFKVFQGPKIVAFRNFEYLSPFAPREDLKTLGPTCGNMAFFVARKMGCSPVVLVGQDLAYASEDYRSHIRGTAMKERDRSNDLEDLLSQGFFFVPKNGGGKVLTEKGFATALFGYEKALIDDPVDCINCGEGAFIRGTRFKSLENCLESELSKPLPGFRERVLKVLREKNEDFRLNSDRLKTFTSALPEILEGIRNVLSVCVQAESALKGEASLRSRVVEAESHAVRLQNEDLYFRTFVSPVLTPFLANFHQSLNAEASRRSSDESFFQSCELQYSRFFKEVSFWSQKIENSLKVSLNS